MDQVSNLILQNNGIEILLSGGITYEEFKKIFSSNLNVLEDYVLENTSVDTIEKWTHKKAKKLNKKAKPTRGKNTLDNWKVIRRIYQTLLNWDHPLRNSYPCIFEMEKFGSKVYCVNLQPFLGPVQIQKCIK